MKIFNDVLDRMKRLSTNDPDFNKARQQSVDSHITHYHGGGAWHWLIIYIKTGGAYVVLKHNMYIFDAVNTNISMLWQSQLVYWINVIHITTCNRSHILTVVYKPSSYCFRETLINKTCAHFMSLSRHNMDLPKKLQWSDDVADNVYPTYAFWDY